MKNTAIIKTILTYSLSASYIRKSIFYLLIFLSGFLLSQKENSKWYFGYNTGLDFLTSPPTILTNSAMHTDEGCSSVSDTSGNLLFYTNGTTIWNASHTIMSNGSGLIGEQSATQACIILKQPGNSNLYYVVTTGSVGAGKLAYSVVDMNLSAGSGSVTIKNTILSYSMTEKLTYTRHCNETDFWIVAHDWNANIFRSYQLSAAGINTTPVLSTSGVTHSGSIGFAGTMKIAPNGKTLGLAIYGPGIFELSDFDNSTGIVSNSYTLLTTGNWIYGCEFSPDGTKFYGSTHTSGPLLQWDLCAGSPTAVVASVYTVSPGATGYYGIQAAIDGKLYIAKQFSQNLAIINNPNAGGSACNFVDNGQSVSTGTCVWGLPNFINNPKPVFTYTASCLMTDFAAPPIQGTVTSGCAPALTTATISAWNFGDPSSGTANSSTLTNPSHIFSAPGTYTVKLILNKPCSTDTIRSVLTLTNSAPNLAVAGTYTICKGEKRIYTVNGANTYTWSTSANTTTIALSPTVTSVYSVTGTGTNTCNSIKQFTITVNKCTGIEQLDITTNTPRLYPNPTTGNLFVETEASVHLIILNQLGEVIIEKYFEAGNYTIDMSRFANGIYSVHFLTGKIIKTSRLVKLE